MPFPQTLEEKPKCIFFTDFDGTVHPLKRTQLAIANQWQGTITLHDSNDWMVDAVLVSFQPIPLI